MAAGRGATLGLLKLFLLLRALPAAAAAKKREKLDAAAAGKMAQLTCESGNIITTSALFAPVNAGAACKPTIPGSVQDVTSNVAAACNGKPSCAFTVCPYIGFGAGSPAIGDACVKPAVPPLGDPCPNIAKDFVVDYSCTQSLGWTLAATILFIIAGYVGMGVLYGSKIGGKRATLLSAHPHFQQWQQVHALVLDGLAYTRGHRVQGGADGYDWVRRQATGGGGGGGDGGRSDDDRRRGSGKQKQNKRSKDKKTAKVPKMEPLLPPDTKQQKQESRSPLSSEAGGGGRWMHVS